MNLPAAAPQLISTNRPFDVWIKKFRKFPAELQHAISKRIVFFRLPATPLVKLGDSQFKKVSAFLSRFGSIPDMVELDHLTVAGDVTFGREVVLRGIVIIVANRGSRIDIPSGAVLENKIVTGNFTLMDH